MGGVRPPPPPEMLSCEAKLWGGTFPTSNASLSWGVLKPAPAAGGMVATLHPPGCVPVHTKVQAPHP